VVTVDHLPAVAGSCATETDDTIERKVPNKEQRASKPLGQWIEMRFDRNLTDRQPNNQWRFRIVFDPLITDSPQARKHFLDIA